VSEIVFVF